MKTPSVPCPLAAPRADVVRGRYLPRHRARIIERDNLFLVEFLETTAPAPTASGGTFRPEQPCRRHDGLSFRNLPVWHVALLWGVALSALALEVLRLI